MSSSSTVNCLLFRFTPCCGGHPAYFARVDTAGQAFGLPYPPGIPYVWRYDGPAPYTDHLGYSLIPGQCYYIDTTTVTVNGDGCGEPWVVPSPTPDNFSETSYPTCEEGADDDPKCNCPHYFEFTSCCTGETLIYNISDYPGKGIVDGSTYVVTLDINDINTASCYTINSYNNPIENPEVVPEIEIVQVSEDSLEQGCNDFFCFLLCQECRCQEFSGTTGSYSAFTCDFQPIIIIGTVDGPQISYDGVNFELLTEPICLKYWVEQTFGLTRIDKGPCNVEFDGGIVTATCPINYKIVNCSEPFNEICVTNNLSVYFESNEVITINGQPDLCWKVEIADTCVSPVTILVTQSHLDCQDCLEKVISTYELTNCNDDSQIIYTNSDLSGFGPYVSLEEYPDDCWLVTIVTSNTPSVTEVTPLDSFGSCIECSQQYYILEDCNIDDPELPIITGTNLSAYVGQVITLASCPDICWQVSETDNTIDAQPVLLTGIETFETCQLCIQPTPVPTPPVYKYKSVKPGYNTPGCSPEKYEQYMCNFSEAMYRQVMVDAYGIEPCCGDDDIKWQIKKELIELKAITDPEYNCVNLDGCSCTTTPIGLTACEPPPAICHNYIITASSFEGTSLTLIGCDGTEKILLIESNKSPLQYNVCGRAGQTLIAPLGIQEFSYIETTTICTE